VEVLVVRAHRAVDLDVEAEEAAEVVEQDLEVLALAVLVQDLRVPEVRHPTEAAVGRQRVEVELE
jgi:hypothetical protein